MPSNQTTNYQLSQWVKSDQVKMEDFNADNAKIDAALKAEADARTGALSALSQTVSAHGTAIAKLGNCQIYTTTYTANHQCGEEHPNTLTFPKKPALITIYTPNGRAQLNIFPQDITYGYSTPSRDYTMHITWQGNTVSWYANDEYEQMNYGDYVYHVFAFCPMS